MQSTTTCAKAVMPFNAVNLHLAVTTLVLIECNE